MNEWLQWHLDARTGPKRILALDGGGVRGLVTLGILQRIEDTLKVCCPHPDYFRLAHYFDLISGTSTGSIVATGLALGWKVAEVRRLYDDLCPKIFKERARGVLKSVYEATPLEEALKKALKDREGKDRQLQSADLVTGLMICAKRIDTGSPWVLTNNPQSKFWDNESGQFTPNKLYELWRIVRASTAAPLYFEPIEVVINDDPRFPREVGLFVDGAVAGLNNPSWQSLLTATLPPYGFGWSGGAARIFMVSVGTGWWRMRQNIEAHLAKQNWLQAVDALSAMVQDTSLHALASCQAVSEPRKPRYINGEIMALKGHQITGAADLMSFQRYDADIDDKALRHVSGYNNARQEQIDQMIASMRAIGSDDPDIMRALYALGFDVGTVRNPGVDGIELEDFPRAFDTHFMQRPA